MATLKQSIDNLLNSPTVLANLCQANEWEAPSYEVQKEKQEDDHRKVYKAAITLEGKIYSGQDISKRLAKCRAASEAVNQLMIEQENQVPPSYSETSETDDDDSNDDESEMNGSEETENKVDVDRE